MMSKDDAKKEQIGEIKLRNVRLSFAALDKPAKDSVNEKMINWLNKTIELVWNWNTKKATNSIIIQ